MKSRSKLIKLLLVFLALSIWSVIFFQFIPVENSIAKINIEFPNQDLSLSSTTPTELLLNYPDPFSIIVRAKPKKAKRIVVKKIVRNPIEAKTIPDAIIWPDIQFKGMIVNRTKNISLAVVIFNQEEHIFTEGERAGNVLVEQITYDSLVCSANGFYKTYMKEI